MAYVATGASDVLTTASLYRDRPDLDPSATNWDPNAGGVTATQNAQAQAVVAANKAVADAAAAQAAAQARATAAYNAAKWKQMMPLLIGAGGLALVMVVMKMRKR